MKSPYLVLVLISGLALSSSAAAARSEIDLKLLAAIERIRAVDNHCHDDGVDAERGRKWSNDNPLGAPEYPDVWALRRDNPDWISAWRVLYGYKHRDMKPENLTELLDKKRQLLRDAGNAWPITVLDKSGIEIALVNATHLGVGQNNSRFRWVPYADPMLWPFDIEKSRLLYSGGPSSVGQLLRDAQLDSLPSTLDSYVSELVEPTLARWVSSGAVAIKFLSANTRSLDYQPVPREAAAAVYANGIAGKPLAAEQSTILENYLFYQVAARAGTQNLVVHIHTGNGNGPYFDNRHADPNLLEPALNSKALRNTKFVLVHGGWPFTLNAQAMVDKPNTYTDFSAQTFYLTTAALAQVLRNWLSWHPEKVLFGTDAYSDVNTPLSDYEEKQWLTTDKSRRALAIALTAMMQDGEVSRSQALDLARMVMRDNAIALYQIK